MVRTVVECGTRYLRFDDIDHAIANWRCIDVDDNITFTAYGTSWYVSFGEDYVEDEDEIDWDDLDNEETYYYSKTSCEADAYIDWINTGDSISEVLHAVKGELENIADDVNPAYLD